VVSTIKKYTLESFLERISVPNIVEIRRKSVPGGGATVGEASFSKYCIRIYSLSSGGDFF